MLNLYIFIYNLYHKWRMRKSRARLEELTNVELGTLNTLDKILPILKEQLTLIEAKDLHRTVRGDLYNIRVDFKFINYVHYSDWLRKSLNIIHLQGGKEDCGYIDLNNSVSGYSIKPLNIRVTTWLPLVVISEEGDPELGLFYGMIATDVERIEKVLSKVTDPYFKKYYDTQLASALQDVLLLVYTINEMVAFYEWRR